MAPHWKGYTHLCETLVSSQIKWERWFILWWVDLGCWPEAHSATISPTSKGQGREEDENHPCEPYPKQVSPCDLVITMGYTKSLHGRNGVVASPAPSHSFLLLHHGLCRGCRGSLLRLLSLTLFPSPFAARQVLPFLTQTVPEVLLSAEGLDCALQRVCLSF